MWRSAKGSCCTSITWVPGSGGAFIVAHADGNLYVYEKSKDGAGDSSFPVIKDQTQFSVAHARYIKHLKLHFKMRPLCILPTGMSWFAHLAYDMFEQRQGLQFVAQKRQKVEKPLDANNLIYEEPWFKTVNNLHLWNASLIDICTNKQGALMILKFLLGIRIFRNCRRTTLIAGFRDFFIYMGSSISRILISNSEF